MKQGISPHHVTAFLKQERCTLEDIQAKKVNKESRELRLRFYRAMYALDYSYGEIGLTANRTSGAIHSAIHRRKDQLIRASKPVKVDSWKFEHLIRANAQPV